MILKWLFDRVVSFIGLCLIWWLLIIIAVLVKGEDAGWSRVLLPEACG